MSLRYAILAALLEGEASGYELSKRFDMSVANFWTATQQQLYRDLDRLHSDGLVAGRQVVQAGRPNKRMFKPTEAGIAALADFVGAPAKPSAIREVILKDEFPFE